MISIMIEGVNQLLYFLFPTIIGAAIYRDYKYNMHQIFYSYPFTKTNYLLGKFLCIFNHIYYQFAYRFRDVRSDFIAVC